MIADFTAKFVQKFISSPGRCCLCQESDSYGLLCAACDSLLMANNAACVRCAVPMQLNVARTHAEPLSAASGVAGYLAGSDPAPELIHSGEVPDSSGHGNLVCTACIKNPPSYRSAIVPYIYGFPVDFIIHELKYSSRLEFGRMAGHLLARDILRLWPTLKEDIDCVVPVPLSLSRLRERGYNQAFEICRWLSSQTGLPVETRLVSRTGHAESQTRLMRQVRWQNLEQAFQVSGKAEGLRLLLLDDVMSTGATLESLASALTAAGAASVDVCALARTPPPVPPVPIMVEESALSL